MLSFDEEEDRYLDEADLKHAVFQLAMTWCIQSDPHTYCAFLSRLLEQITCSSEGVILTRPLLEVEEGSGQPVFSDDSVLEATERFQIKEARELAAVLMLQRNIRLWVERGISLRTVQRLRAAKRRETRMKQLSSQLREQVQSPVACQRGAPPPPPTLASTTPAASCCAPSASSLAVSCCTHSPSPLPFLKKCCPSPTPLSSPPLALYH